jgi:hypothetical protein
MERMNHEEEAAMRRPLRIVVRIAGSVVGLLTGGALLFWAAVAVTAWVAKPPEDFGLLLAIVCGTAVSFVGATVGAAGGAAITQRVLGRRGSFPKALPGAVAGLLVGCLLPLCLWRLEVDLPTKWWVVAVASAAVPIIAGAVIGSGWKAKSIDDTGS